MNAGRCVALTRLELAARLRSRSALAAMVAVSAIAALCGWGCATGRMTVDGARELLPWGYVLGLGCVYRSGLGEDRARSFHEFLVPAFVDAGTYVTARVATAFASLVCFSAAAFVVTLAAFPGRVEIAAWEVLVPGAIGLGVLPALLLAEVGLRTRFPLVAVGVLGLVMVAAAAASPAGANLFAATGLLDLRYPDLGTLWPLAARLALVEPAALLAVGAAVAVDVRPRLGSGAVRPRRGLSASHAPSSE